MKKEQDILIEREVMAFRLGREEYGIDILTVQELRSYEISTKVANAPDYLKGLLNLRGVIVPIIDMRIKLSLGEAIYNDSTVIIILSIHGQTIGIVVDSVSDVMKLTSDLIKPAPTTGTQIDSQYLIGLGTLENRLITLLDIVGLLSFVCDLQLEVDAS